MSPYIVADLSAIPAGDNDSDEILAIQGFVTVPTGVNQTFTVQAARTLGTTSLLSYGKVNAMYFPFDWQGDPAGGFAPAAEQVHPRD